MNFQFNGSNPLDSCVGCLTCSGCLVILILFGVPSLLLAIGSLCKGLL